MQPAELLAIALRVASSGGDHPGEAWTRRAVSASYYALFHTMTSAGAHAFAAAGPAVVAAAARAYDHRQMVDVSRAYTTWRPGQPVAAALAPFFGDRPDPLLQTVASIFVELQRMRHDADYALDQAMARQDAMEAFRLAAQAIDLFAAIEHAPPTRAFLAALLLPRRARG